MDVGRQFDGVRSDIGDLMNPDGIKRQYWVAVVAAVVHDICYRCLFIKHINET